MACTRDIINITTKNIEEMNKFILFFQETLKEYFYYDDFEVKMEEILETNEDCWINIEEEPMFFNAENELLIDELIKDFIQKYPTIEISLDYTCIQMNCGETLYKEYKYDGNKEKIYVVEKFADDDAISFCWHCDEYFEEALLYIEDFEENLEFECPNCGEKLYMDGYVKKYDIKI